MSIQFSIIIPVYNVEKYLRECLDSVLNQSYEGQYEVICVNDGSTDGSLFLLREYEKKYKNLTIIDSENGGTASARNIGIREAKGDYIWFVDSDDWVERNALQIFSEHLSYSQPDVLCFNGKLYYEADGREEQDEGIVESRVTGWEYYNKFALVGRKFHFVCVVLRLYKREFILKNNLFFELGILHEDNLWVPQMCYYAVSVECIADSVYLYRIREGSKMSNYSFEKSKDTVIIGNILFEFISTKNETDLKSIYKIINLQYREPFNTLNRENFDELKSFINWKYYKVVSGVDIKNKNYYRLLKNNINLFKLYRNLEVLSMKIRKKLE